MDERNTSGAATTLIVIGALALACAALMLIWSFSIDTSPAAEVVTSGGVMAGAPNYVAVEQKGYLFSGARDLGLIGTILLAAGVLVREIARRR